jgi:AbiV family abortive infection protein
MSMLTSKQLWELRDAVLDNAARLAEDAELLLANGRWPAAFESAYFSLEEVAKSTATLLAADIVARDPGNMNWKAFWKIWKAHQAKSAGFVMLTNLYRGLFEKTNPGGEAPVRDEQLESKEALELRRARESALYVSWDGGIRSPREAITEERAREMVTEARKIVDAELSSTDAHRRNIEQAASGVVA